MRAWERPGTVSYFDDGRLRFTSGVGVRVHGGGSRRTSKVQSYRLFFRKEYRADHFAPGLIFETDTGPLRVFVLHNDLRNRRLGPGTDERSDWHFVNSLAYDITHRIGGLVSQTKPVRLFLNGEWQGVYVFAEYVGEMDFFQVRLGHTRVSAESASMEDLYKWVRRLDRPLAMAQVSERVDVENMTRWFLSVLFCATGDAFQGPGQFRDDTKPTSNWFWVNWDMDGSFRGWNVDMFYSILEQPDQRRRGRRHSEPRSRLLTILLEEDEGYREYFKRLFANMLNHQVTPEFLRERFDYYANLARSYGVEDLRYLRPLDQFITRRHDYLWENAARHLDTGKAVRYKIVVPAGGLFVNGFYVTQPFEGRYFPNMMLEVALPEAAGAAFSHWVVNGRTMENSERTLSIRVQTDLVIEPRFL